MKRKGTPLVGAVDAAEAALQGGLATIEGMHGAIAGKPFASLRMAPGVADVSETVRVVHDGVTGLVYGCLHMSLAALAGAARLAVTAVPAAGRDVRPGSLAELAIAAVNGFAGDRLARDGNALATTMALRHRGSDVALGRDALAAAYPEASPRLVLFVHGLASNESLWRLHAERHYADRDTTYGTRLQKELAYTPLYLRYNTGLHISENGRQLAVLLERLVAQWPVPVEELVVVGHSMGGLVTRSACHYAAESELAWVRRVRHVIFLGSPHLGAPLEKAANVAGWMLGLSDVTRPLGAAVNSRSAGIKDLRFGALRDQDWEDADLDALLVDRGGEVPLLEGARHYFVASTVTRDPRHPLGVVMGDLLVREGSASGRGRFRRFQLPLENVQLFGAMTHLELLNHPAVYEQIRRWLAPG